MASKNHNKKKKKNQKQIEQMKKMKSDLDVSTDATKDSSLKSSTEANIETNLKNNIETDIEVNSETNKAVDNNTQAVDSNISKGKFPFSTTIYFVGLLLYLELIFHGYHFGLMNADSLRITLFSILIGGLISIIVNLFPKVVNHILTIVSTILLCIIFVVQFLHFAVFQHFLAFFGMLQYTNQAADNFDTVLLNMKAHPIMIILLFLPIVLVSVFSHRLLCFERKSWKQNLIMLGSIIIIYVASIFGMKLFASETYSAFEMYRYYTSVDMTVEKLGVAETFLVDTRHGITGKMGVEDELQFHMGTTKTETNSSSSTETSLADNTTEETSEESTEEVIDTSPNIIEVDLTAVAEESGSTSIASLCEYFDALPPTNRNEYTGMFEGYNVIEVTAEGFSGYALDSNPELFPTLSMMANEGFVFENYYSPLWYGSTLGGEYANLMGSMPKNGGYLSLSHGAANGNNFLFSLGNQMKSIGYETYAFHNNSSTYYDRNLTHPNLGYTWIANGTGLEPQVNEYGTTLWPQSDLVMVQDTYEKYTTKEPFHLYYMTVSGHVVYSWGGNAMSKKNQDVVADLDYSETTKAYLASQYELELAMTELIKELKEHDLYDNTVIILAGDHVPYNDMDVLDELAGYELEDNFEAYKSHLIIWSGSMDEPIKVDKVCSSIDILPTVSNLLGLEYDSRMIIGQDILSDSDGLVMFANRSFITDDYSYNANTGAVTSIEGSEVSEDELNAMKAFVSNKFTAADAITEYDFYKYVAPYKTYTVDKLPESKDEE